MQSYAIDGVKDLALHHFCRAMAWLGEEIEEKAEGTLAPRSVKDVIEEKLFDQRRDLFTDLSLVFMDTTSLSFYGAGGEAQGAFQGSPARAGADNPCRGDRCARPADLHRDVAGQHRRCESPPAGGLSVLHGAGLLAADLGRFVQRQTMPSVLACHRAAFEAIGGVPREILYDRMKTAVIGEDEDGRVVYNRTLGEFAKHYGYLPKACRAYRPETKGKIERPFRYIREDFFLGGVFRYLDDLNAQFNRWLSTVANPRLHATTGRIVNEAFAEEIQALQPLPLVAFGAVLKLERRISHEGMVSVGGNYYSVPDATRRRVVEVHSLADEIRIFEDDRLIARHPVLEGRRQRSLLDGHRRQRRRNDDLPLPHGFTGQQVVSRSLDIYAAIGQQLAGVGA